jgi:hypothetical protein
MRLKKLIAFSICLLIFAALMQSCQKEKITTDKALSLLPKESSFVVVVDMQKVAATEFYNKMKGDEERLKGYNEFVEKTGIVPERDIDRVAISVGEHMREKNRDAVALVFGRFDKEKIITSMKEEAAKEGAEVIAEQYQGQELYKVVEGEEKEEEKEGLEESEETEEPEAQETKKKHNNEDFRLAFLEEGLIAAGNVNYMKKLIDIYKGMGESIEQNEALMAIINEANQADMIWGAGLIPGELRSQAEEYPMSKSFAAIKSVVFSINLETDLDAFIKMKCDSPENAKNLTDAINGFIALGRIGASERPEYIELLDSIIVEGLDDMVSITMHVSKDLILQLSEEAYGKKNKEEMEQELKKE